MPCPVLRRIALTLVSERYQKHVQSNESLLRDFLKAVQTSCIAMSDSLQLDGCTGGADHQHASTLTHLDGLVVYVHAYNRVSAQLLGFGDHLLKGGIPRLPQGPLVTGRPTTHYVPKAREDVSKDVGPQDRLAGDDPDVLGGRPAVYGGGRSGY